MDAWVLLRLERSEIYFLRYTLEAYEGLCVTTTLPGGEGLIRLSTSSEQLPTLLEILENLASETPLSILETTEAPA